MRGKLKQADTRLWVPCVVSPTGVHPVTLAGNRLSCPCLRNPVAQSIASMGQPVCFTVADNAIKVLRTDPPSIRQNQSQLTTGEVIWHMAVEKTAEVAAARRSDRKQPPPPPELGGLARRQTAVMRAQLDKVLREHVAADDKLAAADKTIVSLISGLRLLRPPAEDGPNIRPLAHFFAPPAAANWTVVSLGGGGHGFVTWDDPADRHGVGTVRAVSPRACPDPWAYWTTRNGYCLACRETHAKPNTHRLGHPHQEAVMRLLFKAWGGWLMGARKRIWQVNEHVVGVGEKRSFGRG